MAGARYNTTIYNKLVVELRAAEMWLLNEAQHECLVAVSPET